MKWQIHFLRSRFFWFISLNSFFLKILSASDIIILSETQDIIKSRSYKNMVFSPEKDPIYFCLSLPLEVPEEGTLCIIVLAGLETGQKNLEYITDPGNYALIGYEYPAILKKKKISLKDAFTLRSKTLNIPSDVLDIVSWAQNQSWSRGKTSIAGYSFGGMFVPAIYQLAQQKNIPLGPGIIAYAGADIYPLFYANITGSKFTKTLKAAVATYLLKPLEPSGILPHLKGDFLIINGIYDKFIPFEQAKKLQELTPYPKTIVNLEEPHLSPQNRELLDKINKISKEWLDRKISM